MSAPSRQTLRAVVVRFLRQRPGYALLLALPLGASAGISAIYLHSALARRAAVQQAAEVLGSNLLAVAHDHVDHGVSQKLTHLYRRLREEELRAAGTPDLKALLAVLWQLQDSLVRCQCDAAAPVTAIGLTVPSTGATAVRPASDTALAALLGRLPALQSGQGELHHEGTARMPLTRALTALRSPRRGTLVIAVQLDPALLVAPFQAALDARLARTTGADSATRAGVDAGLSIDHPFGARLVEVPATGRTAVTAELEFAQDGRRQLAYTARLDMTPRLVALLVPGGLPLSPWPLVGGALALSIVLTAVALVGLARLHELMLLREQFVAGVTHEFRTPITQILLYGETLLLERPTPVARERAAAVIVREARRLSHLADNALAFARARRAEVSLAPTRIDLGAVVQAAAGECSLLAAERGAEVAIDATPGTTFARADARSLEQVVRNLVENAVRHGPEGQVVRVWAGTTDGMACLRIDDQGPGVPPAERTRLWEPFARGASTTAPGTGLGLSIVKQLVELQDGRVSIADAPGAGARFEVLLPLA